MLNLRPRGEGGGQAGYILARAFFMKRRSANGLRVPKNGFQRAQKPAIWRPKRPPRHPKRHPKTAHKQIPRDPCFRGPKGGLPKTLLPLGLARETRPNLTPHPLVPISKAGPGRKLEETFVITQLVQSVVLLLLLLLLLLAAPPPPTMFA